mmetsp:Transcript_59088/g.175773  ORF Transcript_59088/g.175773 Transcript_59088/m.175773 type:complete len:232 (+) Transcript_59088:539-1234(+)
MQLPASIKGHSEHAGVAEAELQGRPQAGHAGDIGQVEVQPEPLHCLPAFEGARAQRRAECLYLCIALARVPQPTDNQAVAVRSSVGGFTALEDAICERAGRVPAEAELPSALCAVEDRAAHGILHGLCIAPCLDLPARVLDEGIILGAEETEVPEEGNRVGDAEGHYVQLLNCATVVHRLRNRGQPPRALLREGLHARHEAVVVDVEAPLYGIRSCCQCAKMQQCIMHVEE